ncbi:MAG: polysaccharide biosynthesis tyrosine autokinase [Bacillales bacterium]|jgi:capsular exopolysaccharide synthesis family protein|nr:polysaccharide biosynthesis tyrosine autokinase [Bacillales bacterium]
MDVVFDIRGLVGVLLRNLWIIAVTVMLIVCITAFVSYYLITPIYQAKSDILVSMNKENEGTNPTSGDIELSLKLVDTYRTIIKSPTILEPVIETFDQRISVTTLLKKINIETYENTQVFSILVEDKDVNFAVEASNAIAQEFQSKIPQLMNINNVHILSPAKNNLNTEPIYPKPILNIIISFLFGIFFSVGVILLKEILNTKLASEEKVNKFLKLPVLGEIPSIKKDKSNPFISSQNDLYYKLIPRWKNQLEYIDFYLTIIATINKSKGHTNGKTLLITSPNPGEGKSITSSNLAILMSKSNMRTVYIDMDLRRPSGHFAFQLPNHRGVTSYLNEKVQVKNIIQESGMNNLHIITSGPIPPNSTQLIGLENISELLLELKQRYDMIVIDSPPMFVSNTVLLSSIVDDCIIMVNAKKTRYPITLKYIEKLKNTGANIIGVIINDKKMKITPYYY